MRKRICSWAFSISSSFFSRVNLRRIFQEFKDLTSFSMNEVFVSYLYTKALFTSIIATFISSSAGKKAAIMRENTSRDKAKSFYNLNKNVWRRL